jgi:hypothetical protein
MAAERGNHMSLTKVEKERIADSRMKLQSVCTSLDQIDPDKLAGYDGIQECLEEAEKALSGALRVGDTGKSK